MNLLTQSTNCNSLLLSCSLLMVSSCVVFSLVLIVLTCILVLSWLGTSTWNSNFKTLHTKMKSSYVIKKELLTTMQITVGFHKIWSMASYQLVCIVMSCRKLNDNHYLHQGIPASIWCLEEQKATEFQRFGFLNLQGSCQVLKKNQLKDLEVWGKLRIRYIYHKNISDFPHGFGISKHTPCNPWGNKILLLESKLIWWCQPGPHMALVLQNGWWL